MDLIGWTLRVLVFACYVASAALALRICLILQGS